MDIALIGLGHMGKELQELIEEEEKHRVISTSRSSGLDTPGILKADVIIDFSTSEVVVENIQQVAGLGKSLVIGTTGWYDHLPQVRDIVQRTGIGLVYGSNFSVGVNALSKLVRLASHQLQDQGYKISGLEIHHANKKDSPSGTALELAHIIREESGSEPPFESRRIGDEIGCHEITFDSDFDTIVISHRAKSRRIFAKGALTAAELIHNKKGVYSFTELLKIPTAQ